MKQSTKFENSDIKNKTLTDCGEPNIETLGSSASRTALCTLCFQTLAVGPRMVMIFFDHSKQTL